MEFNLLTKKISEHYSKKLPFVIYSLAESDVVISLLQNSKKLYAQDGLSNKGFVFAPFNSEKSVFYIPKNRCEIFESRIKKNDTEYESVVVPKNTSGKNKYLKLLNKTIEIIKSRKTTKIVVSRFKDFSLEKFSIETLINQLFSSQSEAFRYVWYHPETGLWCGATPETLVKTKDDSFITMALAGTQPFTGKRPIIWPPKEIDEQQLVTDFITTSLQKVTSVLKMSNPHTHKAGSLLHLRTDITGILKNSKTTLTTIAFVLHPTPAVCGYPQKLAKEYILKNEGYSREFYTGFLGPVGVSDDSAILMVNLRCMKIEGNNARIFIGGGITIGSIPEAEWQETQNKMQTMLQVLKPMLCI